MSQEVDFTGVVLEAGVRGMPIVAKSSWQKGERWQANNDVQKIEHDGRFNGP